MKLPLLLTLLLAVSARAGLPLPAASPSPPTIGGEYKANLLYTAPDPSNTGGLTLVSPVPLVIALAVPQSNQEHVYKATLSPDATRASFANLPISMYDLVLAAKDRIYEGITLNRDENSLANTDLDSIEEIFSRSVPFFNQKHTERIRGTPGDDGKAAAIVQWMRNGGNLMNQNGDLMTGHEIRSIRIAFLADVGPGWQVTATRELIRTDVFPGMPKGFLPVIYDDNLNAIRIVDTVKDIGPVTLSPSDTGN